ncbi:lytic transglycosylase domain-containing protein [Ideonella sp.]|uniref:lytic transglycosylase domain-containing protein n=1 Tax=Ideonella sp. TaxID=1929293 RepID=UPI002B4A8E25|nr:lytic transglycosylase domain-containing protein [Ideonella sp.]HJV70727.1 lytic transglycosylase domain-containing protein [Ideonella sp.]
MRTGLFALALCAALPARAELWAFVDGAGVAHFADRAIDSRYTPVLRSARGEMEGDHVPGKTMTRTNLLTWLEFAPEVKAVQPLLREAEAATGIDAELLKALITVESGYRGDSVSPRGAVGLMQITPATAERYLTRDEAAARPVDEHLRDARSNILIGARMLADLWRRLGGVDKALAAWNAGEARVRQAGGKVPAIAETRSHVHMVLELYWALLQQRQLGLARELKLAGPATDTPGAASR